MGELSLIYIICASSSSSQPLLRMVQDKFSNVIVFEGIESIPDLSEFNTSDRKFVIFDDLLLDKKKVFEEDYQRARHKNISLIYCSQAFHMTPSFIRKNCTYICILRLGGGTREINTIIRDYGFDMDKKQLYKMYEYCTKEQFNYLMIDLIVPIEKRFRKFLFEIVNPHSLP